MAVTKRSVKGSALTTAEMDANLDELIGLLTRLSTYVASWQPGANNIPVLDSNGILKVGNYILARPGVANTGPLIGDRSRWNTMIEASNAVYLNVNCYYDGTNWRSAGAGNAYHIYASASGGGLFIRAASPSPATANEVLSFAVAQQFMTVPGADTWSTATLLNGLTSDTTLRYRKQAATNNFQARGRIYNGTGSSLNGNTTICAIPEGYRPSVACIIACAMYSGGTWTSVNNVRYDPSTGYIAFQSALPNGGYIDLNALGWFVEA